MADMTLKKKRMSREEYLEMSVQTEERLCLAAADPMRLNYHVQPPMGWLNDPNGLCQKDGVYHIYHQYVPFYPELCSVLWGHITTRDFIHYEVQEPALYPDTDWDANGAYSGSAFLKDGTMYVYYTGNVRHDDGEYDYITGGREQNTILTTSEDGFHFTSKRLLMKNEDYPDDLSLHVRDPKVFCENGRYYMIQGARDLESRGSILLFESGDLIHWAYRLRFCTKEPFGYMWECPNYLKVDGRQFLIACPQELRKDKDVTVKDNWCGYFPLKYDFEGSEYELGGYRTLDQGFDFYAPQVFQDEAGRWILLGWMSTPDADYDCEMTMKNGWVHAMTVPRELYVNEKGRLCQRPLKELERMRKKICRKQFEAGTGFAADVPVCFELKIDINSITASSGQEFELRLRESAVLRYADRVLSLDLTECGAGRERKEIHLTEVHDLWILSDTSSLEIFVNGGEEVFTSRIFDSLGGLKVMLTSRQCGGQMELYALTI